MGHKSEDDPDPGDDVAEGNAHDPNTVAEDFAQNIVSGSTLPKHEDKKRKVAACCLRMSEGSWHMRKVFCNVDSPVPRQTLSETHGPLLSTGPQQKWLSVTIISLEH